MAIIGARQILPLGQSAQFRLTANAPTNVRPEWAGQAGGYTRPNTVDGNPDYFTWQPQNPHLRDAVPAGVANPERMAMAQARQQAGLIARKQRQALNDKPFMQFDEKGERQLSPEEKSRKMQLKRQGYTVDQLRTPEKGVFNLNPDTGPMGTASPNYANIYGNNLPQSSGIVQTNTSGLTMTDAIPNNTGIAQPNNSGLTTRPPEVMPKADGSSPIPDLIPLSAKPMQSAVAPLDTLKKKDTVARSEDGTYDPVLLGDPNQWNITPEQTVQGQITNITAADSPLMQQARTDALAQINERNLSNSGMAIEAAQNAVYRTALPIATSDADVNARSAGYNADEINKFNLTNQASSNQARQFGAGNIFAASQSALDRALTKSEGKAERALKLTLQSEDFFGRQKLQEGQNKFTAAQNAADRALQQQQDLFKANVEAAMQELENLSGSDRNLQTIYGNLSLESIRQIAAINADVNMDQQSKDYAINQLLQLNKAYGSMISAVGAIDDVTTLLNFDDKEDTPPQITATQIQQWLSSNPNATDAEIAKAMHDNKITAEQMAKATGLTVAQINERLKAAGF